MKKPTKRVRKDKSNPLGLKEPVLVKIIEISSEYRGYSDWNDEEYVYTVNKTTPWTEVSIEEYYLLVEAVKLMHISDQLRFQDKRYYLVRDTEVTREEVEWAVQEVLEKHKEQEEKKRLAAEKREKAKAKRKKKKEAEEKKLLEDLKKKYEK